MGFFSWNCRLCRRSIRSRYTPQPPTNRWMIQAVAFTRTRTAAGFHDGYGSLLAAEQLEATTPSSVTTPTLIDFESEAGGVTVYHRACWIAADRPGYGKPSSHARDQGFFVPAQAAHACPLAAHEQAVERMIVADPRDPKLWRAMADINGASDKALASLFAKAVADSLEHGTDSVRSTPPH